MEEIQFVGLKELEDVDQKMVQTLCTEYYDKVKRMLHNDVGMKIHIKTLKKQGARHLYEVQIQANSPTIKFDSSKHSQQAQWDLASSIHESFKNLMKEIEHHFHEEGK
ncbi:TPA: hypothetical protein HA265_01485 [Candidatus Woesearchaeota archaeon]|nr:hypothetical protein [Candidatus Woesearchaeota archaeon]